MSSTIPLPPREQLCIRYRRNKHTHTFHRDNFTSGTAKWDREIDRGIDRDRDRGRDGPMGDCWDKEETEGREGNRVREGVKQRQGDRQA
jgi:hypothetical protein